LRAASAHGQFAEFLLSGISLETGICESGVRRQQGHPEAFPHEEKGFGCDMQAGILSDSLELSA
jgi:hypothetical protein